MLIDLAERNNLYHAILDIIKQDDNNQQTAKNILMFVEEYINNKASEAQEKEEDVAEGKISSLFKRV